MVRQRPANYGVGGLAWNEEGGSLIECTTHLGTARTSGVLLLLILHLVPCLWTAECVCVSEFTDQ